MLSNDQKALSIVIFGITGNQGSSVYQALRDSPTLYKVVGITRDTSRPNVQKLSREGVEMRAATVAVGNDEQIKQAMTGAEAVFVVTDFWAHQDMEREYNEIKLLADSAFSIPSLKIFLWSGLPSYAKHTKGKFPNVYHFEGKARGTDYILERSQQRKDVRVVIVEPAAYLQNFLGDDSMGIHPNGDGSYTFTTGWKGHTKLAIINIVKDYGIFVQEALEHPDEFPHGSIIRAFSEELSLEEMARQVTDIVEKDVKYRYEPFEQSPGYSHMPVTLQQDFHDFFRAVDEVGYYGSPDDGRSHRYLSRRPETWREFVKENKRSLLKLELSQ